MARKQSSRIGTGFLLGAIIGIGYAAWSSSKSKGEVRRLVREHLGDIVEHMPEMIDRWIDENLPEEQYIKKVAEVMEERELTQKEDAVERKIIKHPWLELVERFVRRSGLRG